MYPFRKNRLISKTASKLTAEDAPSLRLAPRSLSHIIAALIILLSGCLYLHTLDDGHNWGGDFSAYIMQAQSIITASSSEFIESNRVTIEQSSKRVGPVAYPWGFPLLLTPFVATWGLNMFALKLLGIVAYGAFLAVLWLGFRRYHNHLWLYILLCVFASNPYFLNFANSILSDIPFLLFSTISMLLIGRIILDKKIIRNAFFDHSMLGLLMAFTFCIRSNGILIICSLLSIHCIYLLTALRTNKNPAHSKMRNLQNLMWSQSLSRTENLAKFMPYITFTCFLYIWRLALPGGGSSHIDHLSGVSFYSLNVNISYYSEILSRFFHGIPHALDIYYISLPFVLIGIIRRWRIDLHIHIYIIATLTLFIVWPRQQGLRFLIPVLPFYISFLLSGLEFFVRGKNKWLHVLTQTATAAPLLLLIYFSVIDSSELYAKRQALDGKILAGPLSPESTAMFNYLREHVDNTATIAFFKPRVMRMLTGHDTLLLNNVDDLHSAQYICIWKDTRPIDHSTMQRMQTDKRAKLVYENELYKVYKLLSQANQIDS